MKCTQAGEEWRPCTYMPNSLGSRSTVVVRQAGRQTKCLQLTKVLKFDNFNSKAHLGCLKGFMVPITLYQ